MTHGGEIVVRNKTKIIELDKENTSNKIDDREMKTLENCEGSNVIAAHTEESGKVI